MMRHVLAHNGPDEQRIVDHLATLVRPGGCVYLVDGDLASFRTWPRSADLDDLTGRYQALHAGRGNDLLTGLRLDRLLAAAGLEVLEHRGRVEMVVLLEDGLRGPPWAARDAMVAAGLATAADVARWEAMFAAIEAGSERYTIFVPLFCGRRAPGREQRDRLPLELSDDELTRYRNMAERSLPGRSRSVGRRRASSPERRWRTSAAGPAR